MQNETLLSKPIQVGQIVTFSSNTKGDLTERINNGLYCGFIRSAGFLEQVGNTRQVYLEIGILSGDSLDKAVMVEVAKILPSQLVTQIENDERILTTDEIAILEKDWLN